MVNWRAVVLASARNFAAPRRSSSGAQAAHAAERKAAAAILVNFVR